MINRIIIVSVLAFVGFAAYGQAAHAFAPLQCPCDTLTIGDPGITGNEILDIVCPGGELVEGGSFIFDLDEVAVFTGNEELGYSVFDGFEFGACAISDGVGRVFRLGPGQYELCRESLIDRCNLTMQRSIPTLSEWGLVAMAGLIGIAGLIFYRRRAI